MSSGPTVDGTDRWIDVHAHAVPAVYRAAWEAAPRRFQEGMSALPPWSRQRAADTMAALGIAAAVFSVPSPGVWFGDARAARALARAVNEELAEVATEVGGGFYATLPLPDVDAALAELEHAVDVLHADGVVLFSSTDGRHLGHPALDPLLARLHARAATVLIHPCSPCSAEPATLPAPLLDFPFDTARAVVDMLVADVPRRWPDISWILPHAGGVLPLLRDRLDALAQVMSPARPPDVTQLATFHYELSGPVLPRALPALLTVAEPRRLLYGTDAPFLADPALTFWQRALDGTPLLSADERTSVAHGRALMLFPNLRSAARSESFHSGQS